MNSAHTSFTEALACAKLFVSLSSFRLVNDRLSLEHWTRMISHWSLSPSLSLLFLTRAFSLPNELELIMNLIFIIEESVECARHDWRWLEIAKCVMCWKMCSWNVASARAFVIKIANVQTHNEIHICNVVPLLLTAELASWMTWNSKIQLLHAEPRIVTRPRLWRALLGKYGLVAYRFAWDSIPHLSCIPDI